MADLPRLPSTPEQRRAELVERRTPIRRRMLQQSGAGLVPFLICTAIWVAAGAHGPFWPVWILLVVLIPLLQNGWRLYGPEPQLDELERELESHERTRAYRDMRRERRAARRSER